MGCEKAVNEQSRVVLFMHSFFAALFCVFSRRTEEQEAWAVSAGFHRAHLPLKYFLRVLNAFPLAIAAGDKMQSIGAAGKNQNLVASAAAGVGNGQPAICHFRTEDFRDRTVFRIEPYAID